MRKRIFLTAILATALLASNADAQRRIGNWNGSSRSWNNGEMAATSATMTGRGHTVFADADITAGNLAGYDVFIIGEATRATTAGESAALAAWILGGGRLAVFWDSGDSGNPFENTIMTGIGSSIQASGSAGGSTAFVGGNFATAGGPFNIVGQNLDTSPGTSLTGGSALASDWVRYQQLGSGFVFGFADRSDHNTFNPTTSNANGQLLINIVEAGAVTSIVPEPSTYLLMASGLAGLLVMARRRGKV